MAKPTVRMRAPKGTDEANVGADLYRVDNSGDIEVPEEAVATLTGAGFRVEAGPVPVPEGRARMRAPEGATSCSVAGEVCEVEDGVVDVPIVGVAALIAHGFEPIEAA